MTTLLGIHSLSKSYGTQILFEDISFTVSLGARIGLVGPNGSGKSSLLKILVNQEVADDGSITRKQNLRIGYASQTPEFPDLSCEEVLLQGVSSDDNFELLIKARCLLGKAEFTDFSQNASTLSGGWKKRLDIVRALMIDPDLLILDEPTNHLDLEGIMWLEKLLLRERTGYIIVSHDRYFLENVSNTIIELNRCYPQGLFISAGNMSDFMENKTAFLKAQKELERSLSSTVRDEIEWLRKSPKARTTKSRSRIDRAYELIDTLSDVQKRNKTTTVEIEFSASERETRKLLTTKNLTKSLGDKQLFKGIDLALSPGTRLGIMGKNGTGKTTFLKLLAGMIPPDAGTIKYADDLRLVYFDQHREHIPPNITLKEALCETGEMVNYRGQYIHVNGWARRFLFSPDRLLLPVRCLSGGERARILIARLMLKPADILFLDEPTNDLDIPTLEVIEESLNEFAGAVVLISHDRCLMDRICTQILGLGEGVEQQLFADLKQWQEGQNQQAKNQKLQNKEPLKETVERVQDKKSTTKKLSYKEQKELESMDESISKAEATIAHLQNELQSPEIAFDAQKSLKLYRQLGEAQKRYDALFERWQQLELEK